MVNSMAHEVDPTQAMSLEEIPAQPKTSEHDRRIDAFRAANLRVVALMQEHGAGSSKAHEAVEFADDVIAGRARFER